MTEKEREDRVGKQLPALFFWELIGERKYEKRNDL